MTNTGNDTVKDRGSDFKNITEFNRESSLQYGPMSRVHRTANKRVRSFAVGHDIHPFFDVGKILINWIPTMKKNQVAKIRKLSPI